MLRTFYEFVLTVGLLALAWHVAAVVVPLLWWG